MTFYDRLKELCQSQGIEMTKLGSFIGIPLDGATVSRWQTGRMPRNKTLKAIADYFRVDVKWLLYGEEAEPDTRNQGNCEVCPCKDNCKCTLTPQEHEIIRVYRSLSELGKMQMIREIMSVWEQDARN